MDCLLSSRNTYMYNRSDQRPASADWASLAARGLGIVPGREGQVSLFYFILNSRRGNLDWLSSSILAIYDNSLGCRSHVFVEE
jgi:hypothetical protein